MEDAEQQFYGAGAFDYAVPEGFRAAYPLRWGRRRTTGPSLLWDAPQALLAYIVSGEGAVRAAEGEAVYRPDCALFTGRAASLELTPAGPTEYLYLLLENAVPLPAALPDLPCRQLRADNAVRRMLERLCRNGSQGRSGSLYDAGADTARLLLKLCELGSRSRGAYSPLVQDAIDCIREEYAFLTGVEDLADRVGVTKSHLIRVFSAEMGVTPGKFLQDTRLENAMLLLRGREYTIDTIAGLCGFSGANYFCKVFRRATGESPGEYRNATAGRQPDLENRRRLLEIERRQLL